MPSTPPKTPSKKRRRANRSSEEEVYAGPTQSLPSQTPLSPTSNPITPVAVRQRLQRANGVAQSEEAVEQDGLKIGRDRVGTMPLPRLPAIFQALGPSHHAYSFGSDLRLEAFRVLERNGVGIQACEVGHRSGRFDPREQHQLPVALVIWSTEEYHHLWRAVCVELRDFVTRASPPMPIGIEILDITAEEVTRSFPLYSDDPIVLSWSFVESPILSILLETDASLMTAVRRGKGDLPRENPETVYISVPEETETDWIYVRDRIVEVLDDNELPGVAVEISRGTPCEYGSFGSQELPDTIWEDAAVPGISIGPLGSRRPYSSTLGGFVQLEDAEGDWRTFGLTCYHAVFPPKPTDDLNFEAEEMRKWHRDGFSPAEAVRYTIPICQPSLRDYDRQIETWKGEISDDEKRMAKLHRDRVADHPWNEGSYRQLETNVQGIKRKISTAESFIADGRHYLGKVWAGSGRRLTAQQRTLDWGLIEMKSGRVGSNIFVPSGFDYSRKYRGPGPGKPVVEVASPEEDTRVFKKGRTTRWTMGKLNAVKMFTFEDKDYLKDDGTPCRRVSYDYCVAGYMGSSFCEGGDSGAFMMDEDGKFIGLLFGGDLKSALTRVLVAEDLFDDIKHVTGAKVVRLPVA